MENMFIESISSKVAACPSVAYPASPYTQVSSPTSCFSPEKISAENVNKNTNKCTNLSSVKQLSSHVSPRNVLTEKMNSCAYSRSMKDVVSFVHEEEKRDYLMDVLNEALLNVYEKEEKMEDKNVGKNERKGDESIVNDNDKDSNDTSSKNKKANKNHKQYYIKYKTECKERKSPFIPLSLNAPQTVGNLSTANIHIENHNKYADMKFGYMYYNPAHLSSINMVSTNDGFLWHYNGNSNNCSFPASNSLPPFFYCSAPPDCSSTKYVNSSGITPIYTPTSNTLNNNDNSSSFFSSLFPFFSFSKNNNNCKINESNNTALNNINYSSHDGTCFFPFQSVPPMYYYSTSPYSCYYNVPPCSSSYASMNYNTNETCLASPFNGYVIQNSNTNNKQKLRKRIECGC